MIGFLFYAYYMNTDSQSICGVGAGRVDSGQTDYLGMKDTSAATNGNSHSVNFWGLECWWGGFGEALDDVVYSSVSASNQSVYLIGEDETRTLIGNVQTPGVTYYTYIKKLQIGEMMSLLPIEGSGTASTYYCDERITIKTSSATEYMSSRNADIYEETSTESGISFLRLSGSSRQTRLCYRGDYIIE